VAHIKRTTLFSKVLSNPNVHLCFGIKNKLIWTKNQLGRDVICIPREGFIRGRRLREVIIDHVHKIVGHYGQLKTSKYIRSTYWWPSMATEIELFCNSCTHCQTAKTDNRRPSGLLHTLPVPDRPWQSVGIDFVGPLPKSNNYDYLLVVIDRFMSQTHLVSMTTKVTARETMWLYLKEIIHLHGVPESIVLDRDSKFTSIFWKELQRLMGTKLLTHVNSISSSNEWSNRTSESLDRTNTMNSSSIQ
jgi:hypothetical protein